MDPVNDYYGMEMWRQMLGLSGNPYAPPQMQYYGQKQGQQKQQGGSSMNNQLMQSLLGGGTTATGMTPNATNAMGESYYGWGAQTGDWGAAGSGSTTGSGLIAGNEISAPVASAEVGGAAADIGAVGGSAGEGAGMMSSAGPYAALAAAIGAFKLNSDWMSGGSGKTWGGEMEEAWSESFGNNGLWGMFKGLFG